jgi:phosphatidylglycerophosphate synthase
MGPRVAGTTRLPAEALGLCRAIWGRCGRRIAVSHTGEPSGGGLRRLRDGVPNALTVARLLLGLSFPMLPVQLQIPAFLAALATEFLDGTLARRFGCESVFGQILDPIADKTFLVCVLGTLLARGILAPWAALLLALRDVIVLVGSVSVALFWGPKALARLPAAWPGKVTTAVQLALMLWVLAAGRLPLWALVPAALLSLWAGIDYVLRFLRSERRVCAS